jgi:hypothetical protein
MPEALQQSQIETGNTQRINQTLDVVNSSLHINEIPLGPKARLVPNGAEGPHSSEDIKKFTPIKPINSENFNQFTETSLPDFLRTHIGEIARNIMPEGQYRIFVPDGGSPDSEKKLELLKHTIELAQDPDSGLLAGVFDEALNKLGVQRLPRILEDGTEQDTSSAVFTVASLQAALIDQAKELVNEFSKQSAKTSPLIETSGTAVPYTNRGEIYGVVRNNMSDGSVELSGKTGATIDRNISFKSGENTISIPTSHVLQILRESLDTQSPDGQTAKNYGEKLTALLNQSFGDVPQVQSFVETYKKYLDGQATEADVSSLLEQVRPGAFREKEGNFLREAFKQHREHFDDTAKIDSAVREDLVAAQQLVNSMIPPELQKELAILDYEIKQAQEDGDDQRRDELIRDKDKKRQTFYKAIMYAYNVQPDNKSMYELADANIEYTDEERNIGEMVKQRRNQVITYESFEGWGGERQTTRNSMNAIDANRLTCSELLHEFGVELKPDWEELEALQQAVLPTAQHEFNQAMDEYNRQNTAGMEERLRPKKPHMESFIREHFQRELMNQLAINPDDPNLGIVTNILKNSLQTEARLQGMRHMVTSQETELLKKLSEPRFQKLTGNLPERLALTKFREMGLKGVEFLYRRSLTEHSQKPKNEILPGPVVESPAVEELNQKGILLMEIHQDNKNGSLLDQLDNTDVNLKDFIPKENPVPQPPVEVPIPDTSGNPIPEQTDIKLESDQSEKPVPFTPTVPEIDMLRRLERAGGFPEQTDNKTADVSNAETQSTLEAPEKVRTLEDARKDLLEARQALIQSIETARRTNHDIIPTSSEDWKKVQENKKRYNNAQGEVGHLWYQENKEGINNTFNELNDITWIEADQKPMIMPKLLIAGEYNRIAPVWTTGKDQSPEYKFMDHLAMDLLNRLRINIQPQTPHTPEQIAKIQQLHNALKDLIEEVDYGQVIGDQLLGKTLEEIQNEDIKVTISKTSNIENPDPSAVVNLVIDIGFKPNMAALNNYPSQAVVRVNNPETSVKPGVRAEADSILEPNGEEFTDSHHSRNGSSSSFAPTPIESDILTLERHNPSSTNGHETNGHKTNGNGSHGPIGEAPINWVPPVNGSSHEKTEHNPAETVKQLIEDERRNGLERQRIITELQPPVTQPISLIEAVEQKTAEKGKNGDSEEKTDTGLPVPETNSNETNHDNNQLPRSNTNPVEPNGTTHSGEADKSIVPPPKQKRSNRRKTPKPKQQIIQNSGFSDFDDFPSAENTAHSGFTDVMSHSSAPSDESKNVSEDIPEIDQSANIAEAKITFPDKQEHQPTYEDLLQKLADKKEKIKVSYENNNLEAARSKKTEYAREQSSAFSVWFKNNQDEINPGIDALSRFMNNYFAGKIVRGGNVADIGPLNETAEKFYEAFGVDPRTITEKELYPIFKGLFSTQYNHRGPFNQMQAVHILDLVQSCAQFISRDPVSRNDPIYPLVMYLYKDYKKVLQEVMDCRIIDFESPPDTMKNQAVTYPGIHYTGDQVEDESLVSMINYLGNPLTKEMRKKRWSPR